MAVRKDNMPSVRTFADHEVITPANPLHKAIAPASADDDDPVARAEAALAQLSTEFAEWMQTECERLEMLPVGHSQRIPEDYLDANNHMNVMWYTHLFSCALEEVWNKVGLTSEYFEQNHASTFALEGHVRGQLARRP